MFKSQNFCHIASNNRNQVKVGVFVYRTTDDLATVLTIGYFNDRIIDINLHDLIIHEKIDSADATKVQRNLLCVTERSLENVGTTLVKSQWEEDIESVVESIQDDIETIQDDIETIQGDITDIKAKDIEQDGRLDDIESGVAYKATDFKTPITNTNKGITETEETALNSKIDLAANSGRMITDQGVWYAKMYAATVAPAAENGTNYADFSQTDGQGNPVIVLYERQNGAWVQTQTIVPPAEYDGYVPITSKIWDIPEQAGQQGGRILWNHQSKDFTPYPQIISFENAALTGTSTAPTPTESSPNDQIANKEYVDNKTSQQGYHPDLFDVKWADYILDDASWLRADTFSWQSGAVYQAAYAHLKEDYDAAANMLDWAVATQDTNLGSHSWTAIAGNGTKFVALGIQGYVSTSLDGINWTPATQNSNLDGWTAYSVAWDGTKFVALGYSSRVSTSTDGINWTPATQVANFDGHSFVALAWNGTKFVALNTDGYISTSTDGTTWTIATQDSNLGTQRTWVSLAGNGTKFVALGTIGHISTSTDGTTWTPATRLLDVTKRWKSLVWDGVQFVALADSGYISTSTDGTSWSTATKATNLGNHTYSNIAYDGTKFVALNPQGYTSYKVNHIYTETIAGVTITYYLAEDGHKLVLPDQESNVTAIYDATGVAWYYIIDTTNQRFKLPRTKFGFTGIRNSVGGYVEPAIPNIKGGLYKRDTPRINPNIGNAYREVEGAVDGYFGNSGAWAYNTIELNASLCSDVYKDDATTVQPPATQMYLYFYVGNFTQTALENTAGLNAELFNEKVDVGHQVIAFQAPTAANNYTWYRKYADGWVEQGGVEIASGSMITLPIAMADTKYTVQTTPTWGTANSSGTRGMCSYLKTTTSFNAQQDNNSGSFDWQVSGMAAN